MQGIKVYAYGKTSNSQENYNPPAAFISMYFWVRFDFLFLPSRSIHSGNRLTFLDIQQIS